MITILLDNGHGNDTPGKRSPIWPDGSQLLEWQFNRDIVTRTATILRKAGIPVECLVPESQDIALSERCRRANVFARRGDCLLISVHANAGGGSGGEIFTYPGARQSGRNFHLSGCAAKCGICRSIWRHMGRTFSRTAVQRLQRSRLCHSARHPLSRPAHREPLHG